MRDRTEPDEAELEEFESAMQLADALASLAMLEQAGASRGELRQAITAAMGELTGTARHLVDVALTIGEPLDLAITARRPGPRRDRRHLRLVPPVR